MPQKPILIFGAGGAARSVTEIVDPARTEIVAYVDNAPVKQGTTFCGRPVIAPWQIKDLPHEAIFIASAFHKEIIPQLLKLGTPEEKIINVQALLLDMTVDTLLEELERRKDELEVIVTGKSYAMLGISPRYLAGKGMNLANNSQDLYYDLKLVERLLLSLKAPKLRSCIIGLTYYSFHYDMSKRGDNLSTSRYAASFQDLHHADNVRLLMNRAKKHVKPDYNAILRHIYRKENAAYFQGKHECDYALFKRNFSGRGKASETASQEFKKNYPETVRENKMLFEQLLALLENHEITPLVLVVPGSADYCRKVNPTMETEFKEIISAMQKKHPFIFLDWLRLDTFHGDVFYDDSHLNEKGARKLTQLVNPFLLRYNSIIR